ncbi:MAG: polyphosphate polymerase domain-containing protein [Flavobacteriales bacterium]|nr:polyphosphate polymerase domain-containing protein [Flavobacteriales bacterium]
MNLLDEILEKFPPISLKEMDGVKLMRRTETKFVFASARLPELLSSMSDTYRVLEIDGVKRSPYNTVYFDTKDLKFYHQHHNGKMNRKKIRIRTYVNAELSFIEVKTKNNKGKTIKKRAKIEKSTGELSDTAKAFISKHVDIDTNELSLALWNGYRRITLVDLVSKERVTIDLDLEFDDNGKKAEIGEIIIAEVKQEKYNVRSLFIQNMRKMHIRPMGMSKYCIGSVLLKDWIKSNSFKDGLRYNRFKEKVLTIDDIKDGSN